jgi:hypothetical protein
MLELHIMKELGGCYAHIIAYMFHLTDLDEIWYRGLLKLSREFNFALCRSLLYMEFKYNDLEKRWLNMKKYYALHNAKTQRVLLVSQQTSDKRRPGQARPCLYFLLQINRSDDE